MKNGLRGAFSAASLTMLVASVPGMALLVLMLVGLALPAVLLIGSLLLLQLPVYWVCKLMKSASKHDSRMAPRGAR